MYNLHKKGLQFFTYNPMEKRMALCYNYAEILAGSCRPADFSEKIKF